MPVWELRLLLHSEIQYVLEAKDMGPSSPSSWGSCSPPPKLWDEASAEIILWLNGSKVTASKGAIMSHFLIVGKIHSQLRSQTKWFFVLSRSLSEFGPLDRQGRRGPKRFTILRNLQTSVTDNQVENISMSFVLPGSGYTSSPSVVCPTKHTCITSNRHVFTAKSVARPVLVLCGAVPLWAWWFLHCP